MQYKDTLELYDELVLKGTPEPQARAQAQQLGAVGNLLSTIQKDMFWVRLIGAGMIVTFFSNGFFMWMAK